MAPPAQHLHLFSLPRELLDTLTPRTLFSHAPSVPEEDPAPVEQPQDVTSVNSRACAICLNATFASVDDQRQHFRSDWHRYNVKVRLTGGKAVSEAQFTGMLDELEDSLSGSASSDSDNDNDSDASTDAVRTLLSKANMNSSRPSSPSLDAPTHGPITAITYFHSPPSTQLGIYRAIFPRTATLETYVDELKAMQSGGAEGRRWTMFMVAGGHFAGVVVRVSRPDGWENMTQGKRKMQKEMPEMEILRHKTFHRYTTRRKQGGSQGLNDNAKGNAKSAGAMLRRYGEQALRDDIRGLIEEWSEDIAASERIWIRASGTNRKIFMDYPGAIIEKGDERLRTYPFPTRRPTQSELQRCLLELTRVKVTHFTEEELREQDEAYLASLPKPKPKPPSASTIAQKDSTPAEARPPKLTKEEEILREKWSRILDMTRKGRLEPLKSLWAREVGALGGVDARIPEWAGEKSEKGWTLLMIASHEAQADVVEWLLEAGADPTIPVPSSTARDESVDDGLDATRVQSNRTAYTLAPTRPVRDTFRRAAGTYTDRWDWFGAAKVPSALNKEMEEERDSKKKERRKGLKDKLKEREKEREAREKEEEEKEREREKAEQERVAREAAAKMRNSTGPQKLGGSGAGTQASEGLAGLTPEMRMRIERERRARAAEARLKALGGK